MKGGTSDTKQSVKPAENKGNRVGVQVITWGSHDSPADQPQTEGTVDFISPGIIGGNVGHAAMLITIPDTPENRQLVKESLVDTKTFIPYRYKTHETRSLMGFDIDQKPIYGPEPVYTEKVIEIYFSYWPGKDQDAFSFNTYEQDTVAERLGVDVQYDERWRNYLKPEERKDSSSLMSKIRDRVITLGPSTVVHQRNYSPEEQRVLDLYQKILVNQSEAGAVKLLLTKLNKQLEKQMKEPTRKIKLEVTELLLINRFLPDFPLETLDLAKMIELLTPLSSELQFESKVLQTAYMKALLELNGQDELKKYEMSPREISDYDKVLEARDFIKKIEKYRSTKPVDAALFEELKTMYNTMYGGTLKSEELEDALVMAKGEIDTFKGAAAKGDLQKAISLLGSVEIAVHKEQERIQYFKQIQATLADYRRAGPETKSQVRESLITLLQKDPKMADIYLDKSGKNFEEEWLSGIDNNMTDWLKPKKLDELEKLSALLSQSTIFDLLSAVKANELINEAITQGHPPDHVVNLPLQQDHVKGLNLVAMLKAMAALCTSENKFELFTNNCADNCCKVLAAGAGDSQMIFTQRALNDSMGNPQMAYNNALVYSLQIGNPNFKPEEQGYYAATLQYLTRLSLLSNAQVSDSYSRTWNALYTVSSILTAATAGILSIPKALYSGMGGDQRLPAPTADKRVSYTPASDGSQAEVKTTASQSTPDSKPKPEEQSDKKIKL